MLYKDSIDMVSIQLSTLRAKTSKLAQLAEDIKYLQQQADETVAAITAAVELVKTTEVYNNDEETRAKLVAQMEAAQIKAMKYVDQIQSESAYYFDPEQGYDILNSETSSYFLDLAVQAITQAFKTDFAEGGARRSGIFRAGLYRSYGSLHAVLQGADLGTGSGWRQ